LGICRLGWIGALSINSAGIIGRLVANTSPALFFAHSMRCLRYCDTRICCRIF
jgi:hypothetical protein